MRAAILNGINLEDLPRAKAYFIEAMYARAVEKLPEGRD